MKVTLQVCHLFLLFIPLISLIYFKKLFIYIYFWLCWVFVAAWLLSSCGEWGLLPSGSVLASHYGGFSYCRAQALGPAGISLWHVGFSSCSSRALERRLNDCGT